MKILMTSSGGIIKGIESWPEYGLAKELVRKGHDVTVLSSASAMKKHDAKKEEAIDGIMARRFNPVLPSSYMFIKKNKFDLIHMHHLGYMAPISSYGMLAKKNMPSVFTIHGLYHDPSIVDNVEDPFSGNIRLNNIQSSFPLFRPWRFANWFSHTPLKADKITALTNWEKEETKKLGVPDNRIEVVPNGINFEKFKKGKKGFFKKRGIDGEILLFVGQPTRRKGWEYFIRAMQGISKDFPESKAVFVGYRQNKHAEDMVVRMGLQDNVKFLGYLPESEKISAFVSADIFVFPTLYEGFGIGFLEAMAAGLPIITTDVAGNKEIVENGKNGILVKPKDSGQVYSAVLKLLSNSRIRSKMRPENIKKAKQYDWKIVCKKYEEVYRSVIK